MLVGRAVERSDGGLSEAARRLHGILEQHELRLLVRHAPLGEQLLPRVLGVGQDDRDEVGLLVHAGELVGRAGRDLLRRRAAVGDAARIDTEQQGHDGEHDGADAAACNQPAASASVLDIGAAPAALPSHGKPPWYALSD
jgi:hypothetical protein